MNKRRILGVALVLCMVAILAVGGTLAYMTDRDELTNIFTSGKVEIELDEVIAVDDPKTDNLIASDKRTPVGMTKQEYKLHPNMTVAKDPTIHVQKGSEPSYIGAKITVKGDLYPLIGVEGCNNIDITKIASGGLMSHASWQVTGWNGLSMVYENAKCVVYQEAPETLEENAANVWVLYVFLKEPMKESGNVALFEQLTISSKYTNEDMARLNNMSINVQAFAVQAAGFEVEGADNPKTGCFNAMTEAFRDDWNFENTFTTVDEA